MFGSRTRSVSNYEKTADKTYKWRSSEQNFVSWDSEAQEQIFMDKDVKLIPLTATSCVTGSREQDHGKANQRWNSIYSNEFTDFKNDYVKVREFDRLDNTKTVLCEGVYSPTIKEFIADKTWAKFTTNVYCLLNGEVVKLQLSGASITAWIEFTNKCKSSKVNLYDHKYITVKGYAERKNGAVNYTAPIFDYGDITDEEDEHATEVARELETKIEHNKSLTAQEDTTDVTEAAATMAAPEANNDGTIDLSEIPF